MAGEIVTEIGTGGGGGVGEVMAMIALADLVVSVNDVAVIVTVPPAGTVGGAV